MREGSRFLHALQEQDRGERKSVGPDDVSKHVSALTKVPAPKTFTTGMREYAFADFSWEQVIMPVTGNDEIIVFLGHLPNGRTVSPISFEEAHVVVEITPGKAQISSGVKGEFVPRLQLDPNLGWRPA